MALETSSTIISPSYIQAGTSGNIVLQIKVGGQISSKKYTFATSNPISNIVATGEGKAITFTASNITRIDDNNVQLTLNSTELITKKYSTVTINLSCTLNVVANSVAYSYDNQTFENVITVQAQEQNWTIGYHDNFTYNKATSIQLVNDGTDPIGNISVKLFDGSTDKTSDFTVVSWGNNRYTITPKTTGSFTLKITAAGNDTYNSYTYTENITVNKATRTVNVSPNSATLKAGQYQDITFSTSTGSLSASSITFTASSKISSEERESTIGRMFRLYVDSSASTDTYNVNYCISDDNYEDVTGVIALDVTAKKEQTWVLSKTSVSIYEDGDSNSILIDGGVTAMAGDVLVSITGPYGSTVPQKYTTNFGSDIIITIYSEENTTPGTYTLTVKADGNDEYLPKEETATIIVKSKIDQDWTVEVWGGFTINTSTDVVINAGTYGPYGTMSLKIYDNYNTDITSDFNVSDLDNYTYTITPHAIYDNFKITITAAGTYMYNALSVSTDTYSVNKQDGILTLTLADTEIYAGNTTTLSVVRTPAIPSTTLASFEVRNSSLEIVDQRLIYVSESYRGSAGDLHATIYTDNSLAKDIYTIYCAVPETSTCEATYANISLKINNKETQTWYVSPTSLDLYNDGNTATISILNSSSIVGELSVAIKKNNTTSTDISATINKTTTPYKIILSSTAKTTGEYTAIIRASGDDTYLAKEQSVAVTLKEPVEQDWTITKNFDEPINIENKYTYELEIRGNYYGSLTANTTSNYISNVTINDNVVQFTLISSSPTGIDETSLMTITASGGSGYARTTKDCEIRIKFFKHNNWTVTPTSFDLAGNDTATKKISIVGGLVTSKAKVGMYSDDFTVFYEGCSKYGYLTNISKINTDISSDRYASFKLDFSKTKKLTEDVTDYLYLIDEDTDYYESVYQQVQVLIHPFSRETPTWPAQLPDSIDLTVGSSAYKATISSVIDPFTAVSQFESIATVNAVDKSGGTFEITISPQSYGKTFVTLTSNESPTYLAGSKTITVNVARTTAPWYLDKDEIIIPITKIESPYDIVTIYNMGDFMWKSNINISPESNSNVSLLAIGNTVKFTKLSTANVSTNVFTITSNETALYNAKSKTVTVKIIPDLTFKDTIMQINTADGMKTAVPYIAVKNSDGVLEWRRAKAQIATKNT